MASPVCGKESRGVCVSRVWERRVGSSGGPRDRQIVKECESI